MKTTHNHCITELKTQTEWKIMDIINIIAIILFVLLFFFFFFHLSTEFLCAIVWCLFASFFFSAPNSIDSHFFGSVNVIFIASISLQFTIIPLHGIPYNRVGQINKRSRMLCECVCCRGRKSRITRIHNQNYCYKRISRYKKKNIILAADDLKNHV